MRQKEPYVAFFDKKVFALFSPLSSAKNGSSFLDREYISKLTRIGKGVNSGVLNSNLNCNLPLNKRTSRIEV